MAHPLPQLVFFYRPLVFLFLLPLLRPVGGHLLGPRAAVAKLQTRGGDPAGG